MSKGASGTHKLFTTGKSMHIFALVHEIQG